MCGTRAMLQKLTLFKTAPTIIVIDAVIIVVPTVVGAVFGVDELARSRVGRHLPNRGQGLRKRKGSVDKVMASALP